MFRYVMTWFDKIVRDLLFNLYVPYKTTPKL